MLSDKHGWECAEAYSCNPLADNSDDEKKIKKALKEAKSVKEEKLKAQRISSIPKKAFPNHAVSWFPVVQSTHSTMFYCQHSDRPGHYAKYCDAGIPSSGFSKGQFSNQPNTMLQPGDINYYDNENKEFVTNEILDLLDSGRVRDVSQNEIEVLNPLTVAENGQKLRLILDCRYISSFLRVPGFKCDDIRTIRDLFEVGDYFFKFDIKSGYHHIDILEAHQKYLGFSWEFDRKIRYFVLTVLVFGLADAPFVLQRLYAY